MTALLEQSADPIQVPWTRRQEDQLRELVTATNATPWAIGDMALAMVPMGEGTSNNGGYQLLRLLAKRVGKEFNTLRTYRAVALAWPQDVRVSCATFDAHKAFSAGGPEAASERAEFIRGLADEGELITAEMVRKARAQETAATYHKRQPGERILSLLDKERGLVSAIRTEVTRHLLTERPSDGWRKSNGEKVRKRADQLRYAAEILSLLADGGELPAKEEIRERLDPKAW